MHGCLGNLEWTSIGTTAATSTCRGPVYRLSAHAGTNDAMDYASKASFQRGAACLLCTYSITVALIRRR